MAAPELLFAAKLSAGAMALFVLAAKVKKVAGFNRSQQEYVPLKLFRTYSSVQIEGSYSTERKKVLRFSNTMTVAFYFFVLLLCLITLYPAISRKLGFS
jgi:hypothetical protein